EARAGDRALVRHIGLARLFIDKDLPPVVKRADGDIGLEQLEARNDVARLARDLVAAVAGRLADRIGTHAVWPADGDLFRRGQVFRRLLAGEREQEADVVGDAVEALEVVIPFAEAAVRVQAGHALILLQERRRSEIELALGIRGRERIQT